MTKNIALSANSVQLAGKLRAIDSMLRQFSSANSTKFKRITNYQRKQRPSNLKNYNGNL